MCEPCLNLHLFLLFTTLNCTFHCVKLLTLNCNCDSVCFSQLKVETFDILSVFLHVSLSSFKCIALFHYALYMQMWTKEETDQLFDLCERFDLRFIVIADRFPSSRTVEELKDRYYSGMYLFNKLLIYYILHNAHFLLFILQFDFMENIFNMIFYSHGLSCSFPGYIDCQGSIFWGCRSTSYC